MDVFMRNVAYSVTSHDLKRAIARILHRPEYSSDSQLPLNFHVKLHIDRRGGHPKGTGILTLPTLELGNRFLREYGEPGPRKNVDLKNRRIKFYPSKSTPDPAILQEIRHTPYLDPKAIEDREERARELLSMSVSVKMLQFGWECRDNVFSSEREYCFDDARNRVCNLCIDENREIRVKLIRPAPFFGLFDDFPNDIQVVTIRPSQIRWCSASSSLSRSPVIFFSLYTPPAFERESGIPLLKRQRLSSLDPDHARVVPYTSHAIRLECTSQEDVETFRTLWRKAQFRKPSEVDYPVENRNLFSAYNLQELSEWIGDLEWDVAFQVEALVRSLVVDAREMLSLRPKLNSVIKTNGAKYAASLLLHFANRAKALLDSDESEEPQQSIEECFTKSQQEYANLARSPPSRWPEDRFGCLHVAVTPTTTILEGPFPEQSNRVMRSYPRHHDCFLRVRFVDEDHLQFRFRRDIDGPGFVKRRVGSVLLEGLRVAGRFFQFLAYSQSALKEHAVWFVTEFFDLQNGCVVNASSIIKSLGSFSNLNYDPKLIYCPARYGARISQAFTSTDASISMETEEVLFLPDVKNSSWCFTDGVGTISPDLARDISEELRVRRRARRSRASPRAFQVRFMGSKGMLSVDYQLSGRVICLRDSMIKFHAPESRVIEIAEAFDTPRKYYLNRPLIMVLEHLGVAYDVFKNLQDNAVLEAQESSADLERSARLLETHGLGTSFRMTSVMISLAKLGVSSPEDHFYQQMMEFAVHHVLRELKHRARIPVPGGYTLVGVADVHDSLEPNEIFASIKSPDSLAATYLEGDILISRSPTIHPGDVQVVRAIGKPQPGSCFAHEPLLNTVVFSTKGDRPIPSCLGGGDLDGDLYNLIPLKQLPFFTPRKTHPPGEYPAAPKKLLDRPSVMDDVAEFFVEYINSDVLGIIAKNWLITADQSLKGIEDPDCHVLACLHSDAVDYPKSGQPVSLDKIPKLKFASKPDWDAPETINLNSSNHYESQRAIGRLFRDIDLPALRLVKKVERRQLRDQGERTLEDLLETFHLDDNNGDLVWTAVEARVSDFIRTDIDHIAIQDAFQLFGRYASELQTICTTYTLSHNRSTMLTEEEAVIGTIVAKTSQPRVRRDTMAKLREVTGHLVNGIRTELSGGDDATWEGSIERGWSAWRLSVLEEGVFGAKSFGWIALGVIFEAIRDFENAVRR